LLRIGRHFRLGKNKIIVGRNEEENKLLAARKTKNEFYFELPYIVGPVTILQGPKTRKAVETAAQLTASYSDAKTDQVTVRFGREALNKSITVKIPQKADIEKLRVGNEEKPAKKRT
jgi:tRNA-uridine 2-sulfurtransferase